MNAEYSRDEHGMIIKATMEKISNYFDTVEGEDGCRPDIYRRNFAAWCEECDAVFGNTVLAKQHRDTKKHKVNVTEYLVSETAHFSYITSILENDMEPP